MMISPDIQDLMRNMDSRYTLVVTVAKRARQLTGGAPPLTSYRSDKPVTLAIHEIAEGKVEFFRDAVKPPENKRLADRIRENSLLSMSATLDEFDDIGSEKEFERHSGNRFSGRRHDRFEKDFDGYGDRPVSAREDDFDDAAGDEDDDIKYVRSAAADLADDGDISGINDINDMDGGIGGGFNDIDGNIDDLDGNIDDMDGGINGLAGNIGVAGGADDVSGIIGVGDIANIDDIADIGDLDSIAGIAAGGEDEDEDYDDDEDGL